MASKNNLNDLKELLKRGDITTVAKRAGVTTMTVYNVLNGKYENDKVIEKLTEVISEREQKRKTAIAGLLKGIN